MWSWLFRLLMWDKTGTRSPVLTLVLYMRSGNVVRIRGVRDWGATYQGDSITRLTVERHPDASPESVVFVESVALGQIEAIEVLR